MKDLFSLVGKSALITGRSVGIGAMIAGGFVHFGARVYLAARREEAPKRKRDELAAIGSCEYLDAVGGESVRGVQRAFYADIRPDWVLAGK